MDVPVIPDRLPGKGLVKLGRKGTSKLDSTITETNKAISMKIAEAVATAGAIPPLVELMRGQCGPEAQKEAVRALWALADDENNRKSIAEANGIDPLMDLLDNPDQAMRKHAEGTLARLSLVDSNQMLIIKQLVGMLENSGGQEQAAACLANLAVELPQSRDGIVEAGGIPKLLALLTSGSAKIKAHALSAIAQLAFGNQKIQNVVGSDPNGIPALVATIVNATAKETSTLSIWTKSALAVWHIADGNRDNQTKFFSEGAIVPIVGLLTNNHTELKTNAAGAIGVLARSHQDNQAALIRCAAIPLLCAAIKEGFALGATGQGAPATRPPLAPSLQCPLAPSLKCPLAPSSLRSAHHAAMPTCSPGGVPLRGSLCSPLLSLMRGVFAAFPVWRQSSA